MKAPITVIENEINKFYDLEKGEMFKNTRKQENVLRRQLFYYLCVEYTTNSLDTSGKYAGKYRGKSFNHATVKHGADRIRDFISFDKKLRSEVQSIIANIRANKETYYTDFEMLFKSELTSIENRLSLIEEKLSISIAS